MSRWNKYPLSALAVLSVGLSFGVCHAAGGVAKQPFPLAIPSPSSIITTSLPTQTILPFFSPEPSPTICLTPGQPMISSPTPGPTPRPAIVCEGDRVTYRDNGKIIVAEGNVKIGYKGLELTADRVKVYVERKEAFAEGNVTLTQGNNVITTDKIRYDFIKEQGILSPGSGYYAPWYGRAETVETEGEKKISFTEGFATIDDYDQPDYRLEASKFIIYPDDKLIAHNIIFYVGDVPIFWLPYYRRTLKDKCGGFFLYPGYRNSWGLFFLSGYNWCVPGLKSTFHLDYRYRRGLAYGLDGRFYVGDSGKGEWQTYYLKDQEYEDYGGEKSTRERYLVEFDYRQELFSRIGSYLSVHYLSDATIRRDFFRRQYDADSQPESYLYLDRRWDNVNLSLKVRPRLNKFYNVVEKLPEAKLQVQEFQLWDSDFYYQGTNSATNFKKKYANLASTSYESGRFDTFHQLSYSDKYFGWLNFYPSVSIRGDFYTKGPGDPEEVITPIPDASPTPEPVEPPERHDFWRRVFSYSAGVSTDIYGIFPAENDWLEIHKLRHVITPSVNYYFTDNPSVYYDRIYQFDSIDKIRRMNYFLLGFRNQLQTKRSSESGEESWTLIDLILKTPLFTYPDRDNNGRLIGNLSGELEVTPFPWLGLDLDMSYNTYDNQFKEDTLNIWVRPEEDWWVTFSQNYRRSKDRNRVSSEVYFRINPIWALKVYARYDMVNDKFEEESFTIYRDLHSWKSYLRVQRRDAEDEYSFYLAFWVKAFSQSPLDLSN
ncbi:MAG: hypothetical protein RAO92_04520 [Candidatus Euphemobacter frigidus]|nr:hypothetical protein [Candidatus Euphemobacter frigidus]MDP8275651.1 hypothetical protein [Candidatus Euphemobacter frigidus]